MFSYLLIVIFLLFVDTVKCKAVLKKHSRQVTWKDSFKVCDIFGGSSVFQDCQANSCNASRAKGRVKDLAAGLEQSYWINGYVQRSPVVKYKGCFFVNESMIEEKLNKFDDNPKDLNNTIHFCSSQYSTLSRFLYLQILPPSSSLIKDNEEENGRVFHCIMIQTLIGIPVSYVNCDQKCGDNFSTMCGGMRVDNETAFYSAYEILRTNLSTPLGSSCFKSNGKGLVEPVSCKNVLRSVCEFSQGKENIKCIDKTHSWFEAQTTCLFDKGYLINDKSTSCMDGNEDYWIGHFAVDALTWNNENIPNNTHCLKLAISKINATDYKYRLEIEDCNKKLYPLCEDDIKEARSQENSTMFEFPTFSETPEIGIGDDNSKKDPFKDFDTVSSMQPTGLREDITSINNNKNTKNNSIQPKREISKCSIIVGIVGSIVVLVNIFVILVICKRKTMRNKHQEDEAQVQTDLNSESDAQHDRVNLPLTEVHTLLNKTEEGIYNHLEGSEPEQTNTSSNALYDITGHVENEYDVSQSVVKHRGENDLYDISTPSYDLYNTTSTNRNIPHGNDTYDL